MFNKKIFFIIIFVLSFSGLIITTQGQTQPKDVRTFVTNLYIHGLPYTEARAYGKVAVPELVAMLNNPAFEDYRGNIVSCMGMIGDPSAAAPLKRFISKLEGEISHATFTAVLATYQAFGHIAQNGDKEVLSILVDSAKGKYWRSNPLKFHFEHYKNFALEETLKGPKGRVPRALARG